MPIAVQRGLRSQMREYPGSITIQVQRASDPEAAASALQRAAKEIEKRFGTQLGRRRAASGGRSPRRPTSGCVHVRVV